MSAERRLAAVVPAVAVMLSLVAAAHSPATARASTTPDPSAGGACLLFTSPHGDAYDNAPLGGGQSVPNLDIIGGSVIPLAGDPGGFTTRIQVLDLSYDIPQNASSLFLAFHWQYTTVVNAELYAGVRIPSQALGAPADSADFEIGTWDPSSDTYTASHSATGRLSPGPDGTIDIDIPSGSTQLGTQTHPVAGDVLQSIFAASYVESPLYGDAQVDRGPKQPTTTVPSHTVGGGCPNSVAPQAVTWKWDVGAPSGRSQHAIAYDAARHQIVVFSGKTEVGGSIAGGSPMPLPADTWLYDGSAWQRVYPAHSPPARSAASMAFDAASGTVILFGGFDTDGNLLGDTWSWDGQDWTQLFPAHSPDPRAEASMAYDAGHHVLVLFGGNNSTGSNAVLGDTWTWNGSDWSQRLPGVSPPGRSAAAMAYDSRDSAVVLFGGSGAATTLSDTWTWDGSQWSPQDVGATAPAARADASMEYDASHQYLVLAGGFLIAPDTWTWTLAGGWQQVSGAAQLGYRENFGLVYDSASQRMLTFGGYLFAAHENIQGPVADMFTFSGSAWQPVDTGLPEDRYKPAFAWDPGINEFVLFGGYNLFDKYLADTWLFDGQHWTRLITAHSPPPRYASQFAWDGTSDEMVLFSGCCANPQADTWLFDGTDWHQAAPAVSPTGRGDASFVWDPLTQSDVLFGGVGSDLLDDTWEWANGAWTQRSPTDAPSARDRAGAAYDPVSGEVILFSGFGGIRCVTDQNNNTYCTSTAADTWSWDGNDWTQLTTPVLPQGREMPRMAYDSQLGGIVMTTGFSQGLALNDSWLIKNGVWQQLAAVNAPDLQYGGALAGDDSGHLYLFAGNYGDEIWALRPAPAPATGVPDTPYAPLLPAAGVVVLLALSRARRSRPPGA
jgi:hypothetical protein